MFVAPNSNFNPARQEGNVTSKSTNMALRWSARLAGVKGYKHCAPPEHFPGICVICGEGNLCNLWRKKSV